MSRNKASTRKKSMIPSVAMLGPSLILIAVFLAAVVSLLVTSFYGSGVGFTLSNYVDFFSTPFYDQILLNTIIIGGTAAIISILLGYPVAYAIVRLKSARIRKALLMLTILSFTVSGLVRIYSWYIMLFSRGVVNNLLAYLGFGRVLFLPTTGGIIVSLAQFLTTFSVLILIGPLKNINLTLEEAAMSLGATPIRTFFKVTLPLSLPGILAAFLLNFSLGVSTFDNPLILGEGIIQMLTNYIYNNVESTFLDYSAAAAAAGILLLLSLSTAYVLSAIIVRKIKFE